MAFGFPPRHSDNFNVPEKSIKHAYVLAIETAKTLKWNISFTSESGFIAYTKVSLTSFSEEVEVKIDNGNIRLKSECTGSQLTDWGKNEKNIEKFISVFKKLEETFSPEEVELKYAELEESFVSQEEDLINRAPLSNKEKANEVLSIFKPVEGYFITPILLFLNIAIFIIMAMSGVSILEPDIDSLILWGANFRPETLEGGWWRIVSSCFIHIGIMHLLMNMYALAYIGMLLEPYLGKSRFLAAYLLSGIVGSVASLYWHDNTVSAGASGAIFGMYGVFLAMLTTSLIEKSARKALLTSIGVFVVYNLMNGLQGGVDNAAHIGGLLSGIVIGYSFYPGLIKPEITNLKPAAIGILTAVVLISSFFVITNISNDLSIYNKEMEKFFSAEEKAVGVFNLPENTPDDVYLSEIKDNGMFYYEENLKLLDKIDNLDLPEEVQSYNQKLREYCELRLECYDVIYKAVSENTDIYNDEIEEYTKKIGAILDEISADE